MIELIVGLHAINSDEHSLLTLESLLIKWTLAVDDYCELFVVFVFYPLRIWRVFSVDDRVHTSSLILHLLLIDVC